MSVSATPAQPAENKKPVSREQALDAIKPDSRRDTDAPKREELQEAAAKAVEVQGRREFFGLRKNWSGWIITWISALIIFNIALTVSVGLGFLNFADLQWFITAVIVETFLQIVGMGYVAVKFLFSDSKSGPKS